MLAGALDDRLPAGNVSVIYLSGFSRLDVRAVDECPKLLQPLAGGRGPGLAGCGHAISC
jgi:hypothetical protein